MQIDILAHRGWWLHADEKNSEAALRRAFAAGFGVETDLRDCDGTIVVSHDMPRTGAMTLDALLDLYLSYPGRPMLALNVKADGMAASVAEHLERHGVTQYFLFDMSVPDALGYLTQDMTVFTRRSEFERQSLLDDRAAGLWLDAFIAPFVPVSDIEDALDAGAAIALVSPELHGKPHEEAWQTWRTLLTTRPSTMPVMLCTDLPDAAHAYFTID